MSELRWGRVSRRDDAMLTALDKIEGERDRELPVREFEITGGQKVELGAFPGDQLRAAEEDARLHAGLGVMLQVAEHTDDGWEVREEVGRQEITP